MKRVTPLKRHIYELLEVSGKALSVEEIIPELERASSVKKTKQQIRSALNPYDCREILRVGKGTYDLLSRVVNGAYYRCSVAEQEIKNGILSCDNELYFIFDPYRQEDKRQLQFFHLGKLINESNIRFCGPIALPRRQIAGFGEWFRKEKFVSDDELIIRITDLDDALYELIPQKRVSRDGVLIQRKNKEVADCVEKILNRIDMKCCWPSQLIRRVLALYSYKDSCPPDHLTSILERDKRFIVYKEGMPHRKEPGMIEICLADFWTPKKSED